ncbi:apolipoprotein N-acyltransferase [Microbaculum marinum]|uniref:Apolipoprotein N-acyltransferase n=1 Tax=Microbaculum marinum TaxID=1764581 RepID=A0AAW9RGF1_9HYPH
MLDPIASRIAGSRGWRRAALAFSAGAISALAMPPFDVFPVLFLTFSVFVWLIDGAVGSGWRARYGAAAVTGWCFGFGYFLAGLWWVGSAFLVDADIFGWMMPIAILVLPAGLALFTAAAAVLARTVWSGGPRRIFAFALAITLSELARGHVLSGFPWNSYGYALTTSPVMMQSAALFGIEGLTAIAALVFASPAALSGRGAPRARLALPVLAACILAGLAGFGALRLSSAHIGMVEGLDLRIVQPSIPQAEKWRPENRNRIFSDYLDLSDGDASADAEGPDLLIWPESALPFVFDSEPNALPAIAALLQPGTTLVTGMERIERDPQNRNDYRIYNSVMVIDEAGEIRDIYDKAWLVPFGEFLPMQNLLEALGLQQLTRIVGGFTPGPGPTTLSVPGVPAFVPVVCYEAIFSGAFVTPDNRPGWILNVTNDGWFGDSPGPWQHFRQARMRAVEEGLPLVRAANTGISAVIDPYGRIVERLDLGVRGVIDSGLPQAIAPTPFSTFGTWVLLAIVALLMIGAVERKSG